jgi:outer membrane lipoprotein-sorting protein
MKTILALVFVVLITAVFISGCVQQAATGGGQQFTAAEKEQQAYNTVEQEMEQTLGNMTLDNIENELLTQG